MLVGHWALGQGHQIIIGALGVNVFFVISGFLITTLLLREFDRTGHISLRYFYVRRGWRILPPYYFYVVCIVALGAFGFLDLHTRALASAALFAWDYLRFPDVWYFDHVWSLAVEEQFYLVWPIALIACLRRGGRRVAVMLALSIIVASPAVRVLSNAIGARGLYYMFHTRADALMFGAIAALGFRPLDRAYLALKPYAWVAVPFLFLLSPQLTNVFGGAYLYTVGFTLEGFAIVLLMLCFIRDPKTRTGRLLNSAPMVYIGTLSYSLYLWQNLFLMNPQFTGLGPFDLPMVVVAALISYYGVERPALRHRDRKRRINPPVHVS